MTIYKIMADDLLNRTLLSTTDVVIRDDIFNAIESNPRFYKSEEKYGTDR